jgi:Rod binding domain-containing protein
MSTSSSDITLGTIGNAAGIPNLNVADVPANIRNGDKAAKQAYAEGLSFESVLVNELSQQMSKTMFGGDGSDTTGSSDGTSDGGSSSSGLLGGASAYASMIPQALTSSIMSGGGTGLAEEFAQELDPALRTQSDTGQSVAQADTGQSPT